MNVYKQFKDIGGAIKYAENASKKYETGYYVIETFIGIYYVSDSRDLDAGEKVVAHYLKWRENMKQPLLSILIPCTPDRCEDVIKLINCINDQVGITELHEYAYKENVKIERGISKNGDVEIVIVTDAKIMTIGEKRELLYNYFATGLFSIQVDSDDLLAPNAIELILEAIKSNPEIPCITFKEKCMINGEYKSSNHSILYSQWMDNQDGYSYVRCPFYKDVIRTDIAKSVPFPHIRYNEDEQWSMAIKPLLTDEIHIEEELYYYFYEPKETHNERYGITE